MSPLREQSGGQQGRGREVDTAGGRGRAARQREEGGRNCSAGRPAASNGSTGSRPADGRGGIPPQTSVATMAHRARRGRNPSSRRGVSRTGRSGVQLCLVILSHSSYVPTLRLVADIHYTYCTYTTRTVLRIQSTRYRWTDTQSPRTQSLFVREVRSDVVCLHVVVVAWRPQAAQPAGSWRTRCAAHACDRRAWS